MAVFGNIMNLQEAINRLPQFEHQLNKLEEEEKVSASQNHLRNSFLMRCQELHNQLNDHRKRTVNIKTDDDYRRNSVLQHIDTLKGRLTRMARDTQQQQNRHDVMSNEQTSEESTDSDDEESEGKKKRIEASDKREMMKRRQSTMYDDADSDEDEESEKKSTGRTDVMATKDTPKPMPRKPIAITQQQQQPQTENIQKEEDEIVEIIEEEIPDIVVSGRQDEQGKNVVDGNRFMVIQDYIPTDKEDLLIKEGDIIHVLETRSDGWWMAENERHEKGLVPKNFLKHVPVPKERSKPARRLGVRDSMIATAPIRPINREEVIDNNNTMTPWSGRRVECLGDALRCDKHLSYSCHLAPRLSSSNVGFHDLFWHNQTNQVRKRSIRISRILRLVRLEGMPILNTRALVRVALFDENRKRGKQIVSNIHTLEPRMKGTTWNFVNKEEQTRSCNEFADIIIRSNYNLPHVILVIEASTIITTQNGFEEKSLGIKRIPLLDKKGESLIVSRTYVEHLKDDNLFVAQSEEARQKDTTRRIFFKIMDMPKENIHFVDSMPDVLVFNALYLPFFYYYRRRAGTLLIRDNPNPLSADFVSDPLLAVFPSICDQHDVMDAMLNLWKTKKKAVSKKSEIDQTIEFFQTFLRTAFFIHGTQIMPTYDIGDDVAIAARKKIIRTIIDALQKGQLRSFLTVQKTRPINVLDYSLDLLGSHSID